MSHVDFEQYIRAIYQTRVDNLLPYTLLLSQYAVLTHDTREVTRALTTEQRTLSRALQLLPHRIIPLLIDQPKDWKARLRKVTSYVLTRLRLRLL